MQTKSLLKAGVVALLLGVCLFWGIPVLPRFGEIYPWDFYELSEVLFWFSVSLAGAGGLLICRAVGRAFAQRWRPSRSLRIFPSMTLANVLPWHRHQPILLIATPPNFGLIYGAVLWILIFLFMIIKEPRHYQGLQIELRSRDSMIWQKSPWPETLSVYLGPSAKYYINGDLVPRAALRANLQQELNRRMVWTVYFEADGDALNMNAIYAMDTIQGLGAKLVWITPKVRQEIDRKNPSAQWLSN